tara:strand:- start:422 stop:730 length:309 start_codon:yes stop_codon:yes gene_type:complete
MKIKNKLSLTEDELKEILSLFNASNNIVRSVQDGFTCSIEDMSKLQSTTWKVERLFGFKPQINDDGMPNHWGDYVLPDNENAYFSEYELEKIEAETEKEMTK